MNITKRLFTASVGALLLASTLGVANAADKTVVVAYQTDALPSSLGIANGDFEKATGSRIDFRKFNSGGEIFAAIASGDVSALVLSVSAACATISSVSMPRYSRISSSCALRGGSACRMAPISFGVK